MFNNIIKFIVIIVYVDLLIVCCDEKFLYMELKFVVYCEIGGIKIINFNDIFFYFLIYLEYNVGDRLFLNVVIFFFLFFLMCILVYFLKF